MTTLYAGIEAGGTKFVCAIGQDPGNIRERITIPTTTPQQTIQQVLSFIHRCSETYGAQYHFYD